MYGYLALWRSDVLGGSLFLLTLSMAVLLAYLALPFDLVPDFIPVAGQLDDAIVTALVLRAVLRSGGDALLREHWPGPERSRELVARLAF